MKKQNTKNNKTKDNDNNNPLFRILGVGFGFGSGLSFGSNNDIGLGIEYGVIAVVSPGIDGSTKEFIETSDSEKTYLEKAVGAAKIAVYGIGLSTIAFGAGYATGYLFGKLGYN